MEHCFEVPILKKETNEQWMLCQPSSIMNPKSNSVMFVTKGYVPYWERLLACEQCLIYWPESIEIPAILTQKNIVQKSNRPRLSFAKFFQEHSIAGLPENVEVENKNGSMISEKALIGHHVTILPGAYIGREVIVGNHTYIGSGVRIVGKVQIGNGVIIRENAVIGADGLSFEREEDGTMIRIPQFGGTVIEDTVMIGANTVIARGAIDNTVIKKGSLIDNSCFISHNVQIQENVSVVGESILFGSSIIGKNTTISGNVTVRDGISVGESATVGMGAVVTKDISNQQVVVGNPAHPFGIEEHR